MRMAGHMLGSALVVVLVLLSSIEAEDACGSELVINSTRTLVSPGYPEPYKPNLTCSWILKPPNGTAEVYVIINDFQTATSDPLKIYNGNTTAAGLITTYAGNVDFGVAFSNQKLTLLTFSSGANSTKNKGFNITVSFKGCAFTVANSAMTVRGPDYVNSTSDIKCVYNITSSATREVMTFTFTDLNLQKGSIDIKDNGASIQKLKGGDPNPGELLSSSSSLSVSYSLSASVKQNFTAAYSLANKACSRKVLLSEKTSKQTITSPSAPAPGQRCDIIIHSDPDTAVSLTFDLFDLGDDMVVVRDGASFRDPVVMASNEESSDDVKDQIYLSSSNALWVVYTARSQPGGKSGKGFTANVMQTNSGYRVTEGSFSLQSIANQTLDTFMLEFGAGQDSQVILTFDNKTSLAENTTLTVYDGFAITDPLIATLTRVEDLVALVFSNSPRMLLVVSGLQSANQSVSGTFQQQTKDDSLYNSYADSDIFTVTAGPLNDSQTNVWHVHNDQPQSEIVSLQISALSMTDNATTVTVTDGLWDTSATKFVLEQGKTIPTMYLRESSVEYKTPSQKATGVVLKASYSKIPACQETLLDVGGIISSPLYPDRYPFNAECSYTIPVPETKLVFINFNAFDISTNHSLTLKQKSESQTLSGQTVPADIIMNPATDNNTQLQVDFVSKSKNVQSAGGFKLNYHVIDSGAKLTNKSGEFMASAPGTNIFIIQLPANTSKETYIVNFTYTLTSVTPGYTAGRLMIFDGPSMSSPHFPEKEIKEGSPLLSRTNAVWIGYLKKNIFQHILTVSYTTKSCDKKQQCQNGRCLLESYRCNGVNDCGDNTDEIDCGPEPKEKSYAPWQLGVAIAMTFLLTVALVFLLPIIIKRCRRNNYTRFGDSMSPVDT